jgi:hypothetical protein
MAAFPSFGVDKTPLVRFHVDRGKHRIREQVDELLLRPDVIDDPRRDGRDTNVGQGG